MLEQVKSIFFNEGTLKDIIEDERTFLTEEEENVFEAFAEELNKKINDGNITKDEMKTFMEIFYTLTWYKEFQDYTRKVYHKFIK